MTICCLPPHFSMLLLQSESGKNVATENDDDRDALRLCVPAHGGKGGGKATPPPPVAAAKLSLS